MKLSYCVSRHLWPAALLLNILPLLGQPYIDIIAGGALQPLVPAQNLVDAFQGFSQDTAGNTYICSSHNVIRRLRPDGMVQIVAGTGVSGYSGDGGPALSAMVYTPSFCVADSNGNIVFSDGAYHIRRINSSGIISTVAGTGQSPASTDPVTSTSISNVSGLAVDKSGTVYFAEEFFNRIRKATADGTVSLVAGIPQYVVGTSSGDGGPALQAGLNLPHTMTFDSGGDLYFVDAAFTVRRVTPSGTISTVAGNGQQAQSPGIGDGGAATSAPLGSVTGLAVASAGDLYISEQSPSANIRRVDATGTISTVTGSFSALPAMGNLSIDSTGALWFQTPNQYISAIQKLQGGVLSTVVGGNPATTPDGVPARQAWLANPSAMAVSRTGDLYIADGLNCAIRKVGVNGILTTVPGTGNCATSPEYVTAMAVDSHGRVYGTNGAGGSVWSISGGVVSIVPNLPGGPMAIDSQDRLYILGLGNEVYRLAPGGAPEAYVSAVAPGATIILHQGVSMRSICVDLADNLYIELAVNSIEIPGPTPTGAYKITPAGVVSALPSFVPFGLEGGGWNIAVDGGGNIWETGVDAELFVAGATLSGQTVFTNGLPGYAGDGGSFSSAFFYSIAGLAEHPDGSILILDAGNGRVRRIAGSGVTKPPSSSANAVVNAASLLAGGVSPGELVSIFGTALGPPFDTGFAVQNNLVPSTLGTVQVLFDGRPAPITAISGSQINAFVPYEVSTQSSTTMVVSTDGVASQPVVIPVSASAFGIFTADTSGSGPGAVLNQDNSYNGPDNPASAGSVITFYGTGEGAISPALPDGFLVLSAPYPTAVQPVTVSIGGRQTAVLYAGEAPFLPAGIFQIDAQIPADMPSGSIPITVTVGNASTTRRVTVAVE